MQDSQGCPQPLPPRRRVALAILALAIVAPGPGCGNDGSKANGEQVAADPKAADRNKQIKDYMSSRPKVKTTKARRN